MSFDVAELSCATASSTSWLDIPAVSSQRLNHLGTRSQRNNNTAMMTACIRIMYAWQRSNPRSANRVVISRLAFSLGFSSRRNNARVMDHTI